MDNKKTLTGAIHNAAMFLQKEQLLDSMLWKRFVDQFRSGIDGENRGWRGEYWGKMIRGGALVYEYTRDERLHDTLTETVRDMLTVAEPDGRVSSYSRETEFDAWDLWCRKYVLLGMEYYLDICREEALKEQILHFLCRQLDYIMAHIGPEKKRITAASRHWLGVNSSSILEPVVRLYRLTYEQKYLDFASYIVECGGAEGVNIFELAYENKILPYQYGVNKAYEMISCFEGLLEYALVTGSEKYLTACVNFSKAVMASDVTVIGSCGCTHELFDHSAVRQTAYEPGVMQETCVTVTWMKFCGRLLELTGDPAYADAMEQSFYNAYLGALNTAHNACDYIRYQYREKNPVDGLVDTFLPVDSYSPLRAGKRGQMVGGLQLLKDKSYYGCCTCIASAGVGVMAKHMARKTEDGIFLEFYEAGTVAFEDAIVQIETAYPADGTVHITVKGADKLFCRIPGWCRDAAATKSYAEEKGYMVFDHETDITLTFPMPVETVRPITWDKDVIFTSRENPPAGWRTTTPKQVFHDPADDRFIAFTRGPLTLCGEGTVAEMPIDPILPPVAKAESGDGLVRITLETREEPITLIDYASAGKDWQTNIAAWIPTK